MSLPSNVTRPDVRSCSRVMQRASVDLPQPVSPTRPSVSPRSTARLTPSTARSDGSGPPNSLPPPDREVLADVDDLEECGHTSAPRRMSRLGGRDGGWRCHSAFPNGSTAASTPTCGRDRSPARAVSSRTRSNTAGQRGANGQPGGGVIRLGGLPPIGREPSAAARPSAGSAAGPRCTGGGGGRTAPGAGRAPSPARRTSRRRRRPMSATTPRSCVMSTIAVPNSSLHAAQHVQHLGLHRDVQRRGGLVGHQYRGPQRDRHRDHHALPHAAGELVRVAVDAACAGSGCRRRPAARWPARALSPWPCPRSCSRIISTICHPTL